MKTFLFILIIILISCEPKEIRQSVELVTNKGTIVLELYNETPKHRDNFIKLVKEAKYDSVIFHRVIQNFMVQAGESSKKNRSQEEIEELNYRVDAEFHPDLFHKKGALAAARTGNPERASSSIQFYIVQGKVFTDSLIEGAETRINGWLAEHYINKDSVYKHLADSVQSAIKSRNRAMYDLYNDSIKSIAKTYKGYEKYSIPEAHRNVYKSLGGTPHLDQNYTVYGQVLSGLNVVDSIAAVATGQADRPISEVMILSAKLLNAID